MVLVIAAGLRLHRAARGSARASRSSGLGILAVSVLVHRRDHPDRATLRPVGPAGDASPDAEIVAKVT